MVGGIDRYFQIARCYRDEFGRMDRQPEFTQVDLEMSFTSSEGVMKIVEGLISKIFKQFLKIDLSLPLMHMKYSEAVAKYGSDKPDLRFGLEIQNVSHFMNLENSKTVQCLRVPGGSSLSRSEIDSIQDYAKLHAGAKNNVVKLNIFLLILVFRC